MALSFSMISKLFNDTDGYDDKYNNVIINNTKKINLKEKKKDLIDFFFFLINLRE